MHVQTSEADEQKDLGNQAFKAGRYSEAMQLYSKAIALCPLSARTKHAVYYRYVVLSRAQVLFSHSLEMRLFHKIPVIFIMHRNRY